MNHAAHYADAVAGGPGGMNHAAHYADAVAGGPGSMNHAAHYMLILLLEDLVA